MKASLFVVVNDAGMYFAGFKPPGYKAAWVKLGEYPIAVLAHKEDAEQIATLHGGTVREYTLKELSF